ncbi:MAG: DUF4339 domain-containing protein [Prevotellaceae bacterium]|nr:DUF4339 domain-containing protein [Prevotellaceae bacterium]
MNDNNFPTLDRLMEFGMGMGMAQQMVNVMNQTMQTMQVPETAKPVQPKPTEWYVATEGKASGPYTEQEVKAMLLEKKVTKDTLVWCAGMAAWQKAESTPNILKLIMQLPPAL